MSTVGGSAVLKNYKSLADALKAIYPEYDWQDASFKIPGGGTSIAYWKNIDNVIKQLDIAEKELAITKVCQTFLFLFYFLILFFLFV